MYVVLCTVGRRRQDSNSLAWLLSLNLIDKAKQATPAQRGERELEKNLELDFQRVVNRPEAHSSGVLAAQGLLGLWQHLWRRIHPVFLQMQRRMVAVDDGRRLLMSGPNRR